MSTECVGCASAEPIHCLLKLGQPSFVAIVPSVALPPLHPCMRRLGMPSARQQAVPRTARQASSRTWLHLLRTCSTTRNCPSKPRGGLAWSAGCPTHSVRANFAFAAPSLACLPHALQHHCPPLRVSVWGHARTGATHFHRSSFSPHS